MQKEKHKHLWVYPRLEDSIDKNRKNTYPYCQICFKKKINLIEFSNVSNKKTYLE